MFRPGKPSVISTIEFVLPKISVREMNSITTPLGYGFALLVTSALSRQISKESLISVACLSTADPLHPEYRRVRHCCLKA